MESSQQQQTTSGTNKHQSVVPQKFEEDKFSTSEDSGISMIDTGKEMRPLTNIELIRKAEECSESL